MRSSLLAVALATGCFAQNYTPGARVLTYHCDVDDSEQPYALYLPRNFDPAKMYPLVVALHGNDSNHRVALRRVLGRGSLPRQAESGHEFSALADVSFIVACPFAHGSMGYRGVAEKDVYDVVADVKRRFAIDEDRMFLTGFGTGGGGALWLGLSRPDLWAAVAAVCPVTGPETEELAPNALDLPVRLFQGDQDPLVPVETVRRWHRRLLDLGAQVDYVEYPGVRHNAWDLAFRNAAVFDWFAQLRRDRYPDRVRFLTRGYEYSSAYWVQLDGLSGSRPASIEARFTDRNRIEISTRDIDGFTLNLQKHPRFASNLPLRVTVDSEALIVPRRQEPSFTRTARGWKVARYRLPAGKAPGAEGPLAAALASRHIYVYGTADSPGDEELLRRRETAEQAAQWSSPRARVLLSFPVKADSAVTDRDLRDANLILFGTRENNSLIARLDGRLPLALNPGAADYGLVFVAPVNGRYVIVNSGLPWWTGADDAARPGLPPGARPYQVLDSLGDFLLFKGSLANVVAEGRFDQQWKLSSVAAGRLLRTGTVVIQYPNADRDGPSGSVPTGHIPATRPSAPAIATSSGNTP